MSVMPRMFCIGPSLLGYIPNKKAAINMGKPICLYSDHIISIGKSKDIKIFLPVIYVFNPGEVARGIL